MKYKLAQKILDRIIHDNEFSLLLSLHMKRRQESVIRLAKGNKSALRLPEQMDFFREQGYSEDEILEFIKQDEN